MDEYNALPQDGEEHEEQEEPRRPGAELYEWLQLFLGCVVAAVVLFNCVARLTRVDGASMDNTLQHGEIMLIWSLAYTPQQGDIVVLTQESYQEDSIVKRVIATEGQRVDVDYAAGTVSVDGVVLEEEYIKEQMLLPSWGEGINHVTVPEGCIFVMGDNRNESADSRYPDIGIVDVRCVIGHGLAVVFPFEHWKGL